MPLNTLRKRIVITGLANSGKTVFITSLINHLLYHGTDFPLSRNGKSVSLQDVRELPLRNSEPSLKYRAHRATLTQGRFPEKTGELSHFRLRFAVEGWKFTDVILQFVDFPGERLADLEIGRLSYLHWSDKTLRDQLAPDQQRYPELEAVISAYLKLQTAGRLDKQEVLLAYKRILARRRRIYSPKISPSTFILNAEGVLVDNSCDEKDMAERQHCGLPGQEFAPIGEVARKHAENRELVKAFEASYSSYRKDIVKPLFENFASADALFVLVDIPEILVSGPVKFDDMRTLLDDVRAICRPGRGVVKKTFDAVARFATPHWMRPQSLQHIGFVATKSDQVLPDDLDRLRNLLHELAGPAWDCGGTIRRDFTCAAVASTEPGDEPGTLKGRLQVDHKGNWQPSDVEPSEFKVDRLPEGWPRDWQPEKVSFPSVHPHRFVTRQDIPPRQAGLENVISFLLFK